MTFYSRICDVILVRLLSTVQFVKLLFYLPFTKTLKSLYAKFPFLRVQSRWTKFARSLIQFLNGWLQIFPMFQVILNSIGGQDNSFWYVGIQLIQHCHHLCQWSPFSSGDEFRTCIWIVQGQDFSRRWIWFLCIF